MPSIRAAGALLLLAALANAAIAQSPPSREAATNASDGPRLIIRFAASDIEAAFAPKSRIARLSVDAGVALEPVRPMALGAQLVRLPAGTDPRAAAAQLKATGGVRTAVPDRRMRAWRVPNDSRLDLQPYLDDGATSIHAFSAWDVTTGSPSIVVADVDTGVLPHPELAGRILPGYDFVSDLTFSNDGDGRDPDASDPGDWISAEDRANPAFTGCDKSDSSWHGTAVSGTIAANTNNASGIAGIDWAVKILPVRVLGKCEGDFSDIFDGMVWAAGLPVPGVPSNPFPAQVINLSLGAFGDATCAADEDALFSELYAHGVTRAVVAAAGNNNDNADFAFPASCPSVISVAATTFNGNKTTYSNYGPTVDIAAPGGEFKKGNFGFIPVLSNDGATVPGAYILRGYAGTSFSAPIVSGVVSLMLGVSPSLTFSQVRDILRATASRFPVESNCSPTECGSGIVNARAAVDAAIAAAPPAKVHVIEYYNAGLDHYFITSKADEIAALDASVFPGWARTGQTFDAFATLGVGLNPVCRFYLPPGNGDSHFYSALPTECAVTQSSNPAFVSESTHEFYIAVPDLAAGNCPAGTTPVYRLWNHRPDTNHRFTTSLAIRDQMLALGYIAEGAGIGVTMCAPL